MFDGEKDSDIQEESVFSVRDVLSRKSEDQHLQINNTFVLTFVLHPSAVFLKLTVAMD